MHEDIIESIAYEKGLSKCKTSYSREEIITAHTNEMVMNWAKEHHPEVIEKIRKFAEDNISEEDAE
jgi:sugar (pentulose or hexulose) kinase